MKTKHTNTTQAAAVATGQSAEQKTTKLIQRLFPQKVILGGKYTPHGEVPCVVPTEHTDRDRIWDLVTLGAVIEVKQVEELMDSILDKIIGQVIKLLLFGHGVPREWTLPYYLKSRLKKRNCVCNVPAAHRTHSGWICGTCERLLSSAVRQEIRNQQRARAIIYVLHGPGAEEPRFVKQLHEVINSYARHEKAAVRARVRRVHLWTWTEMQNKRFFTEKRRQLITG